MAEVHGKNQRIYVDEVNVSGYARSGTITFTQDLANSEAIADTWKEVLPGQRAAVFDWDAMMETTDGGFDETTFGDLTTDNATDRYVAWVAGTTAGSKCYEFPGRYTGQERPAPYDDVIGLHGHLQSNSAISRGETILQEATITATGAQTGYNVGAVAAGSTTVVVYRVHSITGTFACNIEESSDNGGTDAYASIAALASGNLTTAGVTRKTTTGATEAWKRVNVTTAPTTASITVTVTSY